MIKRQFNDVTMVQIMTDFLVDRGYTCVQGFEYLVPGQFETFVVKDDEIEYSVGFKIEPLPDDAIFLGCNADKQNEKLISDTGIIIKKNKE